MGAKNVFSLLATLDVTCCILPIVSYIHTNISLTIVWLYDCIYIYTIRTYSMVQHIEWDCEARLALVDTSLGFSRCIHIWKKYPCCTSIREIVHRIDLITCSNRTRIGLDIQLARNISMQNGSCSFTWANELVFLFAVPAEWSTI